MDGAIQRASVIEPGVLERASRVIRVLGHPIRLRLLELLEDRERNVTELVQATRLGQATVSQHLRILRAEGVVGDRRDGYRVYYRITEPKVSRILDCIRECDIPDILGPGPSDAGGPELHVVGRSSDRSGRTSGTALDSGRPTTR